MFYCLLFGFITLSYVVIIVAFLIGWVKTKTYEKGPKSPSSVFASLVVAAKNEADNLPSLLNSLARQSIGPNNFELIIVNDHSSDKTKDLLQEFQTLLNFKLLNLPQDKHGKKAALQHGINNSKGQLIITTDADCTHHSKWLETVVSFYEQYKPRLIIGPVLMTGNNYFEKIQALDFFSLLTSAAGASGISRPVMCNGANLAYEKKLFFELSDPLKESFQSGDDVFLLLNTKKSGKKISFLKSKNALVYTKAEKTFAHFFKQRMRWASKSSAYRDFDIIVVSIIVLLMNASLVAGFIASIFIHWFFWLFFAQLILKSLIDFCFLYPGLSFFGKNKLLLKFIPTQLANIFLVPSIAIAGIFMPPKWKK